jgi:hypothetical protein
LSKDYHPALKVAMERARLCWGDLQPGDVVSTMVQDKIKKLYLVVENSRRSSYIRMVSLDDGDLTELPVSKFACRTLCEGGARLYTGTARVFI